jgi:hypothetical protein
MDYVGGANVKIKIETCIRTKTQSFFVDSIVSVSHYSGRGRYIENSVGRIDKIEEGFIILDMSDSFKSNTVTIYNQNIVDIKAYEDTPKIYAGDGEVIL